ncbi:MAG: hypothetical protein IJ344_01940 [Clostridia bacterium]|nr:hypothetical protein [Clostridia bacterium]
MYCVQCGVKLSDGEERCPLCATRVYHPDIIHWEGEESLFPKDKRPKAKRRSFGLQALLTAAVLLPLLIVLLCDLQINKAVTWSGFVIGALLLGYVSLILPSWFKKPHPIIFTPCSFGATGLYLWYINFVTDGDWFLSFALPITFGIGAIMTAVVTLLSCLKRGKFFVFGGAFIALGAFMLLIEFLMILTFSSIHFVGWSLYPLICLALVGGVLIFLGCNRPARESMERKFFI